jgi:hypothetical protein
MAVPCSLANLSPLVPARHRQERKKPRAVCASTASWDSGLDEEYWGTRCIYGWRGPGWAGEPR